MRTSIKILIVVFIFGLLIVAWSVVINNARMKARDAIRVSDIIKIRSALTSYLSQSTTGYPASNGECLEASRGVGRELMDSKALLKAPVDPLWPSAAPAHTNGVPKAGQKNFCYFYYSSASDQFKVSFFLESNPKAGKVGQDLITQ